MESISTPAPESISQSQPALEPLSRPGYLKGSTHVHTVRSGDSATSITDVVRWYTEHDYDFIVITDHNRVTLHLHDGELLVMSGTELTHNPASCIPPPPAPDGKCRIHVNTLFVSPAAEQDSARRAGRSVGERIMWREQTSKRRVDMYQRALDASRDLGGMAQLNHPAWHWGVDGALLAELGQRGLVLVEIANQAFSTWNQGSGQHPSAEALWDRALSAGAVVWGVASDDAHHYYDAARARAAGGPVYPAGTGFVMVRAERDPQAIRAAMERGDFYSSTGVLLASVAIGERGLMIDVASPGEHEITFIGTGGQIVATYRGTRAEAPLPQKNGYVRAVIRDDLGRSAWVQPVFAR